MIQRIKSTTRKGAASFYVVIFAALVFTVIVLSFIRLMLSESSQNTANDLSQSAYDSALAGVEDAKAALSKCLGEVNYDMSQISTQCSDLFNDNCNAMVQYLYGVNEAAAASEGADQGYTCVKLSTNLEDYKVNLSRAVTTTVVPISIDGSQNNHIAIQWYSQLNNQNNNISNVFSNYDSTDLLPGSQIIDPPVVSAGIIESGNDHINTVILRPSSKAASESNQSVGSAQNAYDRANNNNKVNYKALVKCDSGGLACKAEIDTKQNGGSGRSIEYLVLSLPYYSNTTSISFVITKSNNGTQNKFTEQVSVDSTGRANDFYRRVESRLQLADLNFPYPDYALSVYGGNNSPLEKSFYVTNNCWTADNGAVATNCPNADKI